MTFGDVCHHIGGVTGTVNAKGETTQPSPPPSVGVFVGRT